MYEGSEFQKLLVSIEKPSNRLERISKDLRRISKKLEAGKKIKTIDITSPELTRMDCNQISWDLLDADGDKLANGIYLYKISAEKSHSDGGKGKADETGKLVILR